MVSCGQAMIASRSPRIVIRFSGSTSKTRCKIVSNAGDRGKMDLRKSRSWRNARNVESWVEARFQGFRPQVKFTRMTPRLQTSFGAEA